MWAAGAGDDVEQGCLPGTVRADEPDDLPALYLDAHVLEGPHAAEGQPNTVDDQRGFGQARGTASALPRQTFEEALPQSLRRAGDARRIGEERGDEPRAAEGQLETHLGAELAEDRLSDRREE